MVVGGDLLPKFWAARELELLFKGKSSCSMVAACSVEKVGSDDGLAEEG